MSLLSSSTSRATRRFRHALLIVDQHHYQHQQGTSGVRFVQAMQYRRGFASPAFFTRHGVVARPARMSSPWTTTFSLQQQQQQQQQQRRTLFIQTEETPNPASIKFLPGRAVLSDPDGNGFYVTKEDDKAEIARSPLAQRIFQLDGVKSVYLGNDFVTVTKFAETRWAHLQLLLFEVLMEFFSTDQPVLRQSKNDDAPSDTTILDTDDEVVAMIKELIEARVRPAVQEDGGDIRYVGFDPETGMVSVKLAGSCVGCPSSSVTLKQGVENMLIHYIPEVTAVQAIEDEAQDAGKAEENDDHLDPVMKSYKQRLVAAGIPFSD